MANGLVKVTTASELEADELLRATEAELAQKPELGRLAEHIRTCFEEAAKHKNQSITPRLLSCQRAVAGEYEPDVLAEIKLQGHATEEYFNATRTKTSSAEALLLDIMGSDLFGLEATPIPSLPQSATQRILDETIESFGDPDNPVTVELLQEKVDELYDAHMNALQEEAEKRVERMKEKIKDQFAEGGFSKAFAEFLQYLVIYSLSILKGPVIQNQPRIAYVEGQVVVKNEPIPTWCAVSPHDLFPAPGALSIQDAWLVEQIHWDPAALSAMKTVEGWNASAIIAVLTNPEVLTGPDTFETGESERAALENRPSAYEKGTTPTVIEGLEFWGSVPGTMLAEWGMPIEHNQLLEYHQITAILIGSHVVRAIKNPHKLGHRPYYAASFETAPGSIWGIGLPEKMSDCQHSLNAILRAMLDNIALASGFQTSVDMDSIDANVDVISQFPGKIWQWQSSKSQGGRDPVTHWQPELLTSRLIEAAEYFNNMADDRTLIPRYAHGNADIGGAGETARGMGMLLDNMTVGIKRVVSFIDEDIIQPAVQQIYLWNLLHLDDESLKADAQVVPRGVLHAIREHETQIERRELLASTQNPLDEQIFGVEERAEIYRGVVDKMGLDPDLLPSKEELQQRLLQSEMSEVGAEEEVPV